MKKYLLILICITTLLFCCKQATEKKVTDEPATKAIGTIITDSIAPPVVTQITAANAPKVIPVPKPKIIQLKYPYGIGKPSIVNYNVDDGLANNFVYNIVKDKKGNLWICTSGGLNKFDGTHFTFYDNRNGLNFGLINKLFIDKNDNLWVIDYDKVYRFDGQSFQSNPLANYKELSTRSFCEDNQGTIWLVSDKGVFHIKGDSVIKYVLKEGVNDLMVFGIFTDKKNKVFVNTNKGIYVLEKNRFIPFLKSTEINGKKNPNIIGKDRQGNLWAVCSNENDTNLSLIKYDGAESIKFSIKEGFIVSDYVNSLMEDKNGIIWISTRNEGLIRFDGKQFISYTTKDGLPSNIINATLEDDEGNIWVATLKGISRLSYAFMNNLETTSSDQFDAMFAIAPDGTKWVLENNSLIQYRKNDALVYDLAELLVETHITTIIADHKGQLWLAIMRNKNVSAEMARFDGENFYLYGKEQGMNLTYIGNIIEDKQRNICLTGSSGVYKFDGKTITNFGAAKEFSNTLTHIFQDSKEQYWVGTFDSIFYKFNSTNVTRYSKKDGFLGTYVNQINEDLFGNIWIVSEKGVSKFDGKRFSGYGHVDGINNAVIGVEVDTTNRLLWFKNTNGLVTMGFNQINTAEPVVNLYNQQNGFEIIPSHIRYNNTYFNSLGIWGFGLNGIYRFDYNKVKQFKKPLLMIKNIRIDNQQVAWSNLNKRKIDTNDSLVLLNESALKFGKPMDAKKKQEQQAAFGEISFDSLQKGSLIPENLKLPYRNNSITFEFASISISFGKYTQYRYKMDGYTENWSPLSNKDEAFFGNMNEGNYTFHLQAISVTGAQTELSYNFSVLPPWYRTWWAYTLYALSFLSAIFIFIRWRTRALQKDKTILEEKVTKRTAELNQSLENLKSTQSQLIQAEKMASLGELTAGIAHEIQNPLNFVNNFSEVSTELLDEMDEELDKGDIEEAKAISADIKQNLEKINHHGKRADAIVKGMLQHSRSSSATKEPTDINKLADEYLRLAYHGLRAKDKSFNATMKTEFDETIGNINIIPQDIGRVILNLITNAFYATNEKQHSGIENYEPTVTVSTKKVGTTIEIAVKDNGNGIPQKVIDKIFQPFFTTKPTGQGTGLGLSLSYDIVKAHGGELNVETKENEGTIFIIQIPNTK